MPQLPTFFIGSDQNLSSQQPWSIYWKARASSMQDGPAKPFSWVVEQEKWREIKPHDVDLYQAKGNKATTITTTRN